nr:apoptotic chromatin condensation inducer in the nucleus-like [Nerophis lumbriciformis]
MADLEDVTLDGRPLQSLRVADLKAALEERGLSKSGQKNALVKRLKGALMLENLQKTSTPHVGLQPNSQIGEEMSQNSFIKQYLAKQQELLRQRLEREAREAYDTNEQEDHIDVNNSTAFLPQAKDLNPASADQHKAPGPSDGEIMFVAVNEGEANSNQEAHMSAHPASGSVTMNVTSNEHRRGKSAPASDFLADSDDDESEDGEEDGDDDDDDDDDDWGSNIRRRTTRQPARALSTRERCGASRQQQQQHIPSLLSPQLRQPTPPPSPPPELSFPLPDTPKQSPPSPDVAAARHSPSTSSSGSSSSDSRSSSPEPQKSGLMERKPGPLTLLARKMESEGAFAGAGWQGGTGQGGRNDSSSPVAASFDGIEHAEGLSSTTTVDHVPVSMIPGINQGISGTRSAHSHVPVSVHKTHTVDDRESEFESVEALELQRQRLRSFNQEPAIEDDQNRALQLEQEENERFKHQQALEREEQEALQKKLASERERLDREQALAKELEVQEQTLAKERALELESQRELERQRALEQERLQQEAQEREKEREIELEKIRAREEKEKALEKERLEREKALEAERKEKERIEKERILEQERLERERLKQEQLDREKALEAERKEKERIERERALEQERLEREKLEQERLEREKALEAERKEKERIEREKLEQEREKALEAERREKERIERERAMEQERLKREKLEQERLEKEKALELERLEREKALEKERQERERLEKERLDHECLAKERLEKENLETACQVLEQQEKQHPGRAHVMQELLEQRLASDGADEAHERLKHNSKEHVKEVSDFALKNKIAVERIVKERANEQELIERETPKELDTELPPSEFGSGLGLTPPTPPFSTGPDRKTEAGIQEDGKAPLSKSESQEAESSLSSQPSSLRKLRFLRDHPIQAQSATSMATKWPHNFTDTPQPQKSLSYSPVSFREQQEGKTSTKQECNSEEQFTLNKKTSAKGFTNQVSGDNLKDDTVRQDEPAKKSTKRLRDVDKDKVPSSPVNAVQLHGRDGKREEKKTRKRSSSNDSSSSESDSGSSSSRSSSSSSSLEKVTISRNRRERKPDRTTSPLCIVTAVAQDDCIQETQKASPYKRERSVEKTSTRNDEASQAKKPFLEIPAEEQMKRKYGKGLEEKEEGSEQRQAIESSMEESEKLLGANEEARKAFSARKISLVSSKSPGTGSTDGDQESGTPGGRKRRWGSSTVATAKKPSISITTDSLKSLIPDIRPCTGQDAVVDLHPEEVVLSDAEEDNQELSEQDLQIRRTVTQEVPSDIQENGQKPTKRICEDLVENNIQGDQSKTASLEEKPVEELETRSPSHPNQDVEEINTGHVAAGNTLIRRSISQQKTGVSITIDDPVRTTRQPSPPRGKVSNIVHVSNLVRPFTLGQLKELLGRTGTLVEDGFWIDKIKSHCYVTYSSSEEAVATREALHGVKWPQSNPKVLTVDFCQQDELDFHKGLSTAEKPGSEDQWLNSNRFQAPGLPPLLPKRDQWAEREREMERREKARSEREWDRDKVRDFGKPRDDGEAVARRSRSRERRRKERGKSKDKKTEKKEKATEEPPAKLLDDLFRKTKAAPCIYWLPLTDEQFAEREAARAERMKEREKRLKQQQHEDEEKKREDERKERTKGVSTGDRGDGRKDKDQDRERERDRGKDRDNEKRRDGYRRPGAGSEGGSRRSRSRSDPRDRRR